MQLDKLRMIVGFTIILSHLLSFAMILLGADLVTAERLELSLLIGPIFSVYVTSIVRRFVTLERFDRTPVHPALTTLGIGAAVIFSIAVPVSVWSFEAGRIEDFESLKTTIGIIETALGIYTGALIDRLFGNGSSETIDATPSPSQS